MRAAEVGGYFPAWLARNSGETPIVFIVQPEPTRHPPTYTMAQPVSASAALSTAEQRLNTNHIVSGF